MSSSIQQLAAKINGMEREIRSMSTTPQLAYSSIEESGAIDSNHYDGRTMAQFGGQFDGSFGVAVLVGPTPPTPSAPIVTAAIGGLTVQWDGLFADADYAPMDFSRVEVHISTDPAFVPDVATTLVATIESPRGSLPFVARPIGTYYVALVARSLSGAASPASATVGPTVVTLIANDALASLVTPEGIDGLANNFAITMAPADILTIPPTVPAGISSACISVVGEFGAKNTSASTDSCSFSIWLSGYGASFARDITLAPSVYGSASGSDAYVVSALTPGTVINLRVEASTTGADWTAFAGNYVKLRGFALWFR